MKMQLRSKIEMDTLNKHPHRVVNPAQQQSLRKLAKGGILLDSYDDIFSEFDPSPYSERTISDDFIIQAKRVSRNKSGNKMSLRLLLPANKRKEQEENMIVKRLHSYFKSVHQGLKSEVQKANIRGLLLTLIGTIVLIAASSISFMKPEKYYVHLMLVLFEPAGWFLLWAGFDHFVNSSKETKKDIDLYAKMIKTEIMFLAY